MIKAKKHKKSQENPRKANKSKGNEKKRREKSKGKLEDKTLQKY